MGILTADMKRVVAEQRLGFHATVCPDGSPNLSPKGLTLVWDDDHLFFCHIRSPQTVANIRRGSLVEVNIVDPLVRKGYRFKGPAVVHDRETDAFVAGIRLLAGEGLTNLVDRIKAIVVIRVERVREIVSPVYDDQSVTEEDVRRKHRARFARLDKSPRKARVVR